jgi:hypothetical protein
MLWSTSAWAMRPAARLSLPHVKQWTKQSVGADQMGDRVPRRDGARLHWESRIAQLACVFQRDLRSSYRGSVPYATSAFAIYDRPNLGATFFMSA